MNEFNEKVVIGLASYLGGVLTNAIKGWLKKKDDKSAKRNKDKEIYNQVLSNLFIFRKQMLDSIDVPVLKAETMKELIEKSTFKKPTPEELTAALAKLEYFHGGNLKPDFSGKKYEKASDKYQEIVSELSKLDPLLASEASNIDVSADLDKIYEQTTQLSAKMREHDRNTPEWVELYWSLQSGPLAYGLLTRVDQLIRDVAIKVDEATALKAEDKLRNTNDKQVAVDRLNATITTLNSYMIHIQPVVMRPTSQLLPPPPNPSGA